jgi:hypothetical protein
MSSMLTKAEKLAVFKQDASLRTGTTYAKLNNLNPSARYAAAQEYPHQQRVYWAHADNAVEPPLGIDVNAVPDMTTVSGEPLPAPIGVDTPVERSAAPVPTFRRRV